MILSFISVSWFAIIYAFLKKISFPFFLIVDNGIITKYGYILTSLCFILFSLLLTFFSFFLAKKCSKDSLENIKSIEIADNNFIASYIGYFFLALSINEERIDLFFYLYIILLVFVYLSNFSYFNPLYLIFGYHFYNILTGTDTKIFLITRKKIRKSDNITFDSIYRINDLTYIDLWEKTK